MRVAVVIPVGPGRVDNLLDTARCLADQITKPELVVVVEDGPAVPDDSRRAIESIIGGRRCVFHRAPRHEPGLEQPRNIGTRVARSADPDITHVAFLDSDIVVRRSWLAMIRGAYDIRPDRVMVCPYEWLPPGVRYSDDNFWEVAEGVKNDPRWPMILQAGGREYRSDLSAGLACFSGNLVWPVAEFERIGGYWSEIHHGRCEDGELGLRAVAMGVPISFAAGARGWHQWHPVNMPLLLERNARDVPMLNARHPWVEGSAVFMTDRDGKAFDVRCRCGQVVATNGWWAHVPECPECSGDFAIPVVQEVEKHG